jgi:hypothetical protein
VPTSHEAIEIGWALKVELPRSLYEWLSDEQREEFQARYGDPVVVTDPPLPPLGSALEADAPPSPGPQNDAE